MKKSEREGHGSPAYQNGKKQGIIIIQIDGLSRPQFEKALRGGNLPYVKKMLLGQKHFLHSFYSGLPSSTPAVQAELFYGVKCAVPSFGFFDRATSQLCTMLQAHVVNKIERSFESVMQCLLNGGSAYSDIYRGGALKASFCVTGAGLEPWTYIKKIVSFHALCAHLLIIPRLYLLIVIELILSIIDFIRGVSARESIISEMSFIAARVGICVLLRELVVFGMCNDIRKSIQILHCNFLGYDEQAHRRGPSSRFAHWTLKGIDKSIRCIAAHAEKNPAINYEFWIYSDHGQESTEIYFKKYGISIRDAIANVTGMSIMRLIDQPMQDNGIQLKRIQLLGRKIEQALNPVRVNNDGNQCSLSAVGPVGHLYIHFELSQVKKLATAFKIVNDAHVPAVFFINDNDKVVFVSSHGAVVLDECDKHFFTGCEHKFADEILQDFDQLVRHPDAGDLVLSGWCKDTPPLSFSSENGSHGGPGPVETHGFLLRPSDVDVCNRRSYLRPSELRTLLLSRMEFFDIIPKTHL